MGVVASTSRPPQSKAQSKKVGQPQTTSGQKNRPEIKRQEKQKTEPEAKTPQTEKKQEIKKYADNKVVPEKIKVKTAQQIEAEREHFRQQILREETFKEWEECEKEHILVCIEHWYKTQPDEKKYVLKEWLINKLYVKLDIEHHDVHDIRVFSCAKGCCQERVQKKSPTLPSYTEVMKKKDGLTVRDAKMGM